VLRLCWSLQIRSCAARVLGPDWNKLLREGAADPCPLLEPAVAELEASEDQSEPVQWRSLNDAQASSTSFARLASLARDFPTDVPYLLLLRRVDGGEEPVAHAPVYVLRQRARLAEHELKRMDRDGAKRVARELGSNSPSELDLSEYDVDMM
jgi:hypothetical protein